MRPGSVRLRGGQLLVLREGAEVAGPTVVVDPSPPPIPFPGDSRVRGNLTGGRSWMDSDTVITHLGGTFHLTEQQSEFRFCST